MTIKANIHDISRDEVSDFQRNGFMSVNNIASKSDIKELLKIAESLIKNKAGFDEGALFDFTGDDRLPDFQTAQLMDVERYNSAVRDLEVRKSAKILAQKLLGPSARMIQDHLFYKPKFSDSDTPWHQDHAFFPSYLKCQRINIWIPLQDVDETNGCMHFLPSTGEQGILPQCSCAWERPSVWSRVCGKP